MLFVAKAYPLFKPPLLAAMTRLKAKEKSAVTNRRIAILEDLLALCEFIIPSVKKRENVRDVDRWNEESLNIQQKISFSPNTFHSDRGLRARNEVWQWHPRDQAPGFRLAD